MSGDDYNFWEHGDDPWQHLRVPPPPPPDPHHRERTVEERRRRENFAEWAASGDPMKRFRAAHGGWDGFTSTPTG